jgi:hypothetical protein
VLTVLAPAEDADGKKVRCKGTKVAVKVGRKTTCRPFAKLFPKPKDVDLRLAHLRQVLSFDPAKAVRGMKRKRARTLQSGFGAAGKRAQRKLLKVLPKALALIDRRKRGARLSLLGPGPALASKACQYEEPTPVGHTGGASVGAFGDNGGYVDAPAGGGMRVRLTFLSCGGVTAFNVPECPTADGSVDASGTGQFRATIEVFDGNQLVSRNSSVFEEKAKVEGEVGADAKLKHIDVEHTEEVFIVASGGIVIRGGVIRKVRIKMPGGQFDPASANVRFYGDPISGNSGADSFASTARAAIARYQEREPRWSSYDRKPFCAQAVFNPESNTLKLKKGNSKTVSVHAKAQNGGGQATKAKWTFLNQVNADFTPGSSETAAPTVSYTVKSSSPNYIEVTAKFTSTAGVGEDKWRQPVEPSAINKIVGTFSGRSVLHVMQGDSVAEWSGNVTFERFTPAVLGGPSGLYKFKSGFISVSFSGNGAMTFSAPLCSQSGSEQLAFSEIGTNFTVLGTGPEQIEPYEYSFAISSDNEPIPMVDIELKSCAEASKELEGEKFKFPAAFGMTNGGTSTDGLTYAGSDSNLVSGSGTIENWSFTGSE